ncbi:MAG: DEAD/DEAH box helicase, partial [Aggregatilineales bacterium]
MDPYDHQLKVYDLLATGKNVILRAPTGAGKTQASIYPFLAAMDITSDIYGKLPRKCIYSVPMRVLAKQFHVEYKKSIQRYNTKYSLDIETAIQTGDMPEDRELTRDLIFATIDQTLSSFLMSPYGLSRGRANLNLGAVLSSYLVFDEFHLYSPDSTLPTVLQMLRLLNGITPFVLMTATFSDALIHRLADTLNAEVVGLSAKDRESFADLQSQQKTRRYHASTAPLTPQHVLDVHEKRSIVIFNTVNRARMMYQQLTTQAE